MSSTRSLSRLTGLAYLGIIAAGLFAELGVRQRVIAPGDAETTAVQLAAATGLFRLGILADVAMVSLDVVVAIALFTLLRRIDPVLSGLAAALRLIQAAVIAANLMNLIGALMTVQTAGPARTALAQLQVHALVYDLGLVFFGLSCLAVGALLWRGRSLPRPLALGVALAGGVYLVGSTVALLAPAWTPTVDPLYGLAFLAELGFAGWLLLCGLRELPSEPAVG